MTATPLISVLLPVHNGMPFLPAAVESILGQSLTDFELVLVNNGGDDGSLHYLTSLKDKRARLYDIGGVGLIAALNFGLRHCRGKYLARMDADDISAPERLACQAEWLERHPQVGMVCTNVLKIDSAGLVIGAESGEISNREALVEQLVYRRLAKPIIHPSVMLRAHLIKQIGGYRNYQAAEDRDVWLRLSEWCDVYRMQQRLLHYRVSQRGISRSQRTAQKANSLLAAFNYLALKRFQVDFYVEHPEYWADFQRLFHLYALRQAQPAAAFEHFKEGLRQRRYKQALVCFLENGIFDAKQFFPAWRVRRDGAKIMRMLDLAEQLCLCWGAADNSGQTGNLNLGGLGKE